MVFKQVMEFREGYIFKIRFSNLVKYLLMHPFSVLWKHQKTLRFYGFMTVLEGRERMHWERMG